MILHPLPSPNPGPAASESRHTSTGYRGRVSWLTERDSDWQSQPPPPRNRLKLVAVVLAGWLAVSLIVLVGLLRFDNRDSGHRSPATGPATSASSPAAGPGSSATSA